MGSSSRCSLTELSCTPKYSYQVYKISLKLGRTISKRVCSEENSYVRFSPTFFRSPRGKEAVNKISDWSPAEVKRSDVFCHRNSAISDETVASNRKLLVVKSSLHQITFRTREMRRSVKCEVWLGCEIWPCSLRLHLRMYASKKSKLRRARGWMKFHTGVKNCL